MSKGPEYVSLEHASDLREWAYGGLQYDPVVYEAAASYRAAYSASKSIEAAMELIECKDAGLEAALAMARVVEYASRETLLERLEEGCSAEELKEKIVHILNGREPGN